MTIKIPRRCVQQNLKEASEYINNLERYIEHLEAERAKHIIHLIQLTKKCREMQAVQIYINN